MPRLFSTLPLVLAVLVVPAAATYTGTRVNVPDAAHYRIALTDEKSDIDYIPLGRHGKSHSVQVQVAMEGSGLTHSMSMTIEVDWFPNGQVTQQQGSVTCFLKDNGLTNREDNSKYAIVIYRADQTNNKYMYLYLKLDQGFINKNIGADRSHAIVASVQGGPDWLSALTDGGQDPDEKDGFPIWGGYAPAKMIIMAEMQGAMAAVGGTAQYNVALSTEKKEPDYVSLGIVPFTQGGRFTIGVVGWGATHTVHIDVGTDFFAHSARGNGEAKVTAFLQQNRDPDYENCHKLATADGGCSIDATEHMQVRYSQGPDRKSAYLYLQIDPEYFGCDVYAIREPDGEAVGAQCKAAAHSIDVLAVGGPAYIPGNAPDGAGGDPNFVANLAADLYFKATKVDLSTIPAMDKRLVDVEANLTSNTALLEDQGAAIAAADHSSIIADQGTKIADQGEMIAAQGKTITDQAGTIATQADTIAAFNSRLAKLEAWIAQPPVPAGSLGQPASCTSDHCIQINAEDGNMNLAADGGTLTFQSDKCGATDLCAMALDLEALKTKFVNN